MYKTSIRFIASALVVGMMASLSLASSAQTQGKLTGGIRYQMPEWFKESFLEIADDAIEAAEAEKHLILFMHLNECPYCAKVLEESFTDAPFVPWIQSRFDVVEINVRGDREVVFNESLTVTERELAEALKVRQTPALIFLDATNKAVFRSDGYRSPKDLKRTLDFIDSKSYLTSSLNEYIVKTSSGPSYIFRDHPSFSDTRDLSTSNQPVMVVFEDVDCDSCDLMHDTLMRDEVVNELLGSLTVVRLDARSEAPVTTPSGEKTTPKDWSKSLGLFARPAIAIYDGERELLRIAGVLRRFHFQTALRYAAEKQYAKYPSLREFSRAHRDALLQAGHTVDLGAQ